MTFRLRSDFIRYLEVAAEQDDRDRSRIIEDVVEQYVCDRFPGAAREVA